MHLLRLINSIFNFTKRFLRALAIDLRHLYFALQLRNRSGVHGFHGIKPLSASGKIGLLRGLLLRQFLFLRKSGLGLGAGLRFLSRLFNLLQARLLGRNLLGTIGSGLLAITPCASKLITPRTNFGFEIMNFFLVSPAGLHSGHAQLQQSFKSRVMHVAPTASIQIKFNGAGLKSLRQQLQRAGRVVLKAAQNIHQLWRDIRGQTQPRNQLANFKHHHMLRVRQGAATTHTLGFPSVEIAIKSSSGFCHKDPITNRRSLSMT